MTVTTPLGPHEPHRTRRNWTPPSFIDPSLAGTAKIDPPGPFVCGDYASITLTYTAGRFGIDDTGAIRICFRFATDQGAPQFTDPSAPNYVSVEASNAAVLDIRYDFKLNTRPWDRTIVIRVVQGFMREGDRIVVRFGDQRAGSPGIRMQTFVDPFYEFQVLVDPIATGSFVALAEQPVCAIIAGPPARWHAVAPTLRHTGEAFALSIRADDRWGNPTAPGPVVLRLSRDAPVTGVPEKIVFPHGATALRVEGLSLAEPGIAEIVIADEAGEELARSNPVTAAVNGAISCWADLHAQSGETIGSGSVVDYCVFARDAAFLDAVGHQGNDFQITPEFWAELNETLERFNEPGRFLTVQGYEWSGNTALGGDRNVFFLEKDRAIRRSSHALVPDRSDEATDCHDARALFEALTRDREDAVCWAHCGGRYADIGYAHDIALERSVEVHSSWGTFEWLLEDAFRLGYRVGVVANSDGHKGRPGAEQPGASQFGALGGLTCFLVTDLSRAALFHAMRARRHYATTGVRLQLSVEAELGGNASVFLDDPSLPGAKGVPSTKALMGDIVTTSAAEVALAIELAASSAIVSIEIRNGLDTVETIRPGDGRSNGTRFFASWSGAEYRGRFRQTVWDGELTIESNDIASIRPVNFFNPDKQPRLTDTRSVTWTSITTGNFAGLELELKQPNRGSYRIRTSHGALEGDFADIGTEPRVLDCGKLARKLSIARLPDQHDSDRRARLQRSIALKRGDNPLYVAITFEDGHQAWSSPIYLVRQ
ncbi:DUF3604 domain-containing protein [Bradyrhizobium cenepequi]